jgi:GNAT superfamily N-acetyltransferase
MHITLTEQDDPPEAKSALEGLTAFNAPFVGGHGHTPLSLVVRREPGGAPVGGAYGWCYGGWYFLHYFYLPEDMRGAGQGRALIARIEAEARARGCIGAWLDTFSFQAPGFYEKQGYARFGTLDDHPPGHARHFLFKRFS